MLWLKRLTSEFGFGTDGAITLYSDNKACISIAHTGGAKGIDSFCFLGPPDPYTGP